MTDVLFFELIRVAMGQQGCLSLTPSAGEWLLLYEMAERQALLGVCFAGVKKLEQQQQMPPQQLYFQWLAVAAQIQGRNEQQNKQCRELQKRLNDSGLRSSILKGQGVAALYPEELQMLRQPGDIDVYVDCGRRKALEYVRSIGQKNVEWDIKHLHLHIFKDTEVEMHYQVENLMVPWRNRRWHRWYEEHTEDIFCQQGDLITPYVAFNQVYILLHTFRHAVTGGVGLRQVMDCYFVVQSLELRVHGYENLLRSFGMLRFTRGLMWLLGHVFGLERERMLCEPDEKEGRFLLDEIMQGGNFGHYDERYKTRRRGHVWTLLKITRRNVRLLTYYPMEVLWTPWWYVRHFFWKRYVILTER